MNNSGFDIRWQQRFKNFRIFDGTGMGKKLLRRKITAHLESMETLQMKSYTAVIEKCPETGMYVGFVPGFPGAHSQGKTLDELHHNLREVIEMLLEDGEPRLEAEFVGTQNVLVA